MALCLPRARPGPWQTCPRVLGKSPRQVVPAWSWSQQGRLRGRGRGGEVTWVSRGPPGAAALLLCDMKPQRLGRKETPAEPWAHLGWVRRADSKA